MAYTKVVLVVIFLVSLMSGICNARISYDGLPLCKICCDALVHKCCDACDPSFNAKLSSSKINKYSVFQHQE